MLNEIKILKSFVDDKLYIGVVINKTETSIRVKNLMQIDEDEGTNNKVIIVLTPYIPWRLTKFQIGNFNLADIDIVEPSDEFAAYYSKKYVQQSSKKSEEPTKTKEEVIKAAVVDEADNVIYVKFGEKKFSPVPMSNNSPSAA